MFLVMKIKLKVTPWSKTESITIHKDILTGENIYMIKLSAQPVNWQANKQLIKNLAKYFWVRKSQIVILKWITSSWKIVQIHKVE